METGDPHNWKIRLLLLPLIVSWVLPGPTIVRALLTTSCPWVSVMVPVTLKLIVSPGLALAISYRSVPAVRSRRISQTGDRESGGVRRHGNCKQSPQYGCNHDEMN